MSVKASHLSDVIPAKAGISVSIPHLGNRGSRFRGNDAVGENELMVGGAIV
jgi:hypothetical protein